MAQAFQNGRMVKSILDQDNSQNCQASDNFGPLHVLPTTTMRVSFLMIFKTDMERLLTWKIMLTMKESLKMENHMALECLSGLTAPPTRVNFLTG